MTIKLPSCVKAHGYDVYDVTTGPIVWRVTKRDHIRWKAEAPGQITLMWDNSSGFIGLVSHLRRLHDEESIRENAVNERADTGTPVVPHKMPKETLDALLHRASDPEKPGLLDRKQVDALADYLLRAIERGEGTGLVTVIESRALTIVNALHQLWSTLPKVR